MKSRGLKTKFLVIALIAGVGFTTALIGLRYLDYRAQGSRLVQLGDATLTRAVDGRLGMLASTVIENYRAALTQAIARNDQASLQQTGQAMGNVPGVMQIRIRDTQGRDLFSATAAAQSGVEPDARESRIVETTLQNSQLHTPLGTLSLKVGESGLAATSEVLRDDLHRMEERQYLGALWKLTIIGSLLTGMFVVIAWMVARRFERPIAELIRSADRIGAGDYTHPLELTNVTEVAALEHALERMRQKLRQTTITSDYLKTVLNSMNDAVVVTGPDGTIRKFNEAAVRLFGYPEEEILGQPATVLLADSENTALVADSGSTELHETVVRTRAGQTIPVSFSGSPIAAVDAEFQGSIFVIRNITDRKRAERRIRYLARYDALTKIPNRMQFQHLLQQALARSLRSDRGVLLLYLDLDQFKEINDTFGHAAGDRTLEVLSERLTRILPRETVVGRLAGDEFGLFLEGLETRQGERAQAANIARMVLTEISKAFYLQNEEVFLTASIGVAFCPKDAENVIDLIRNADAAMYHSKQNGGNSFAFYSPEMNAAAVERLMLKSKLRRALEREEFVMFYQPKIDLTNGKIVGAEALLRWRLPGYGDIPPSQFIPLAEETNLILGIGEWVINRVCADYHRWVERGTNPGRISINLSLKQLRQTSFITRCRSIFKRQNVSPTSFELEITETTLMKDPRRTIKILDELYAMGIHLSIDDFGTGYSSLSALQQFPIGTLKIDQSFVRGVGVDSDDATIVRTIIDMGKSLEMEVVAEGVETQEQLAFLRERGCHFGQGRLFGDAMGSEEFLALVARQTSNTGSIAKLFG